MLNRKKYPPRTKKARMMPVLKREKSRVICLKKWGYNYLKFKNYFLKSTFF